MMYKPKNKELLDLFNQCQTYIDEYEELIKTKNDEIKIFVKFLRDEKLEDKYNNFRDNHESKGE